jgi:hypothetical protein
VTKRGEHPVDGRRASLLELKMLREIPCHGPRPEIGVVRAGRGREEIEERSEVSRLGRDCVLGVCPGFELHVQVEPRHEAFSAFADDGRRQTRFGGDQSAVRHGESVPDALMSRKAGRFDALKCGQIGGGLCMS